jgi:hypothetical protein
MTKLKGNYLTNKLLFNKYETENKEGSKTVNILISLLDEMVEKRNKKDL